MFRAHHGFDALLTFAYNDIVPATGKAFSGYTWQQEAEIGSSSKEIAALFGSLPDPQLSATSRRLANRSATSHLRRAGRAVCNTPVTFTILDSPIINAGNSGRDIYVTGMSPI
jgi:hypothetical protein